MSSKSDFSEMATERYALALYELGQENSEIDKMELEAKNLQELYKKSSEFFSLITDPTHKRNEQMEAIKIL